MRLGFPWTHVQSHFTDDRLRDHHIHAIDARQIHSGDALQFISEKRPDIEEIALGVLDDDPGIRVAHHIFVASKAPWFEITDGLPQYPERSPKT